MKRTHLTHWLLMFVVALLALGCAAQRHSSPPAELAPGMDTAGASNKQVAAEGEREALDTASAGMPTSTELERKIIYNVDMQLIVKDTDQAFGEIERLVSEMGGFVSESNVWREDTFRRGTITVRVPAGQLEDALAQFRALALDVESENVDSQDVTEEYVDLGARLRNEQRTETELLELLASRSETGKTEDILEVHRELSNVRAQIEQISGRMRYLENLSAMATVRITVTPDALLQPIDVAGWRPQGTARDAVRMLLRTMQFFADAAIVFFLYIVPTVVVVAIPIAALVVLIRALWRGIRRQRAATE
jgi:hypothetical protein